ncbi:MAG TPA: hypothetical protein VLW17_12830 [Thermoanaerobaculaceae bacterium]|nr:hypothetical protein [Thermoanaerobaculaceae bacterium]
MPARTRLAAAALSWLAALAAASAPPAPNGAADVLLLRDGRRLAGVLTGCGPRMCTIGDETIDRSRIAWIGFGQADAAVPAGAEPTVDTLLLLGGGTTSATLLGVDADQVETEAGSYPRGSVGWVHLAAAASPPAAPPAPAQPDDRCPPTAEADARVAANRRAASDARDEIARRWTEYRSQIGTARENVYAFQVTARACPIREWIAAVLIGLVAPDVQADQVIEEASEQSTVDISAAIEQEATVRGGAAATAAVVAKVAGGEKPWVALPPATMEKFRQVCAAAGAILASWNDAPGDELSRQLELCAGRDAGPPEEYEDALGYLAALKAGLEELPRIQTLVEGLRRLDDELPALQGQAFAACVDRARCLGQPVAACDGLRPPAVATPGPKPPRPPAG